MNPPLKAYLDIETAYSGEITIVGVYRTGLGLVQLIGPGITLARLQQVLRPVERLYTYCGSRFDLPVIRHHLGLEVADLCDCHDLMYDCWHHGLYGGLKRVEEQLGRTRTTRGLNGLDAMRLWERYVLYGDHRLLDTLLRYNRDDVMVLPWLEATLLATPSP